MKNILRALVLLIISAGLSFGQDTARNAVNVSFGFGSLEAGAVSATGHSYGIGFQRSYLNSRLRVHPNVNFGSYSQRGLHVDSDLRSFDIRLDVNFIVIRYRTFSVFVGGGMFARRIVGTIEAHPLDGPYKGDVDTSQLGGANLSLGFRVDPKNERIAIELVPFSLCGLNYIYSSFTSQLRAVYKL